MTPFNVRRRGLMLVLSSPSGAGKTTISRRLIELDDSITMSISATTRPPRPGETDGEDYFFVEPAEFDRMVGEGELLESATVFGHCYGTPAKPVRQALAAGRDVLFDIDWQGCQQLGLAQRDDLVTIFILPPSTAELERRLRGRGQDSDQVVADRMSKAAQEITHWAEYDYVVVNDDIDVAVAQVRTVLSAERLKRLRQTGLVELVKRLQRGF